MELTTTVGINIYQIINLYFIYNNFIIERISIYNAGNHINFSFKTKTWIFYNENYALVEIISNIKVSIFLRYTKRFIHLYIL